MEGEQFRGRAPADNFERTVALRAADAISRLSPIDFLGRNIQDARDEVARSYGFANEEHQKRILTESVSGDRTPPDTSRTPSAEERTEELRAQGLSDDEIIDQLRAEGLIVG